MAGTFKQFKTAFDKNDLQTCVSLLSQLKLQLTQITALAVTSDEIKASKDELLLARDILEHGVFLSVKLEDEEVFERNFAQLKSYYGATRCKIADSPREHLILGLNMLRLLVQNRIAEFHTELELIPAEVQLTPYLRLPIQLEQWLMEGAYNKVLTAKLDAPDAAYNHFLDKLSNAVRDEIASCSERAYQSVTLASAKKLLMFSSDSELQSYSEAHGWAVRDGRIFFQGSEERGGTQIAATQLISNSLTYARELERIV